MTTSKKVAGAAKTRAAKANAETIGAALAGRAAPSPAAQARAASNAAASARVANATRSTNSATIPETENKLFYSPHGEDIRVVLPAGGIAIVGAKPRSLPRNFWRHATALGCLTKGGITADQLVGPDPGDNVVDPHTRAEMIAQGIRDALLADDDAPGFEDAFTAAGLPSVVWLEKRLGFSIQREERDAAFAEVQREDLEEEETDPDPDANDNTGNDD